MIATLTPNPTVDFHAIVDEMVPDDKLRVRDIAAEPGGGGVNVARVVQELGGDVVAILTSGGESGRELVNLLGGLGLDLLTVAVEAKTRRSISILAEDTGSQYRLVGPGPPLGETHWSALVSHLALVSPTPSWVVLSGSMPDGIRPAAVSDLVERVHERGGQIAVDTSGDALACAVDAGADLIKPNRRELERLLGEDVARDDAVIESAARRLVGRGVARVVVSLGADGALSVADDGAGVRFRPPPVEPVSTVGAGDSMVGAMVVALAQRRTFADAVRFGVAAGSAAVITPGSQLCRRADVARIHADVTISTDAEPT